MLGGAGRAREKFILSWDQDLQETATAPEGEINIHSLAVATSASGLPIIAPHEPPRPGPPTSARSKTWLLHSSPPAGRTNQNPTRKALLPDLWNIYKEHRCHLRAGYQ